MALTSKNIALAQDFIELKKRVNAMIDKRIYNNPLNKAYGTGSSYEYNNEDTPVSNQPMRVGSVNKIIEPMDAISPTIINNEIQYDSLGTQSQGDIIKAMDVMDAKLSVHEYFSDNPQSTSVDCMNGCAGLCKSGCGGTCTGSCTGGCRSCGGECGTECQQNCGSGCWGVCAEGCGNSCTGGCKGGCGSDCNKGCSTACTTGNCTGSCTGGCKGGCKILCADNCSRSCGTYCEQSSSNAASGQG